VGLEKEEKTQKQELKGASAKKLSRAVGKKKGCGSPKRFTQGKVVGKRG